MDEAQEGTGVVGGNDEGNTENPNSVMRAP